MSSLALEIDLALQRLDPPKASRLERLLRDGLALALGDEAPVMPSPSPAAGSRSELFARRFAPLNAVPDRDLSDIVNENRGESGPSRRMPGSRQGSEKLAGGEAKPRSGAA